MFVARDETKALLVETGIPDDRLTVSGIPVRPILADPVDREAVLRRFDLNGDVPILLISAGAAGGGYTQTIVRQSLELQNPFQAVVVCGHNPQLKAEIEAMVAGRPDQFRVLGFTDQMADLIRVATLFVGKPGGLSSSECMAVGLPMVLIKPIPGQEERNSDFLLEEGAAIRCNYETTVGFKIDNLLAHPERISSMAENARRIGKPNAGADIGSVVLSDQREQLWISHAAQRSILTSSEKGVPPTTLESDRRICTLVDTATDRSAGLITEAQLLSISRSSLGKGVVLAPGAGLTVSSRQLSRLRRHRFDPSLLLTLRNILGAAPELSFAVRG